MSVIARVWLVFLAMVGSGIAAMINGAWVEKVVMPPAVDTLVPDNQWKVFYFTNAGAPALTRYEFSIGILCFLEVADIYCAGDSFGIFSYSSLLATTPPVNATCSAFTVDPNVAVANPAFSSHQVILAPGPQNISIVPVESPFTAGRAAIRLRPALP